MQQRVAVETLPKNWSDVATTGLVPDWLVLLFSQNNSGCWLGSSWLCWLAGEKLTTESLQFIRNKTNQWTTAESYSAIGEGDIWTHKPHVISLTVKLWPMRALSAEGITGHIVIWQFIKISSWLSLTLLELILEKKKGIIL